ncbi:MAG TPA: hypothetical protein VN660_02050 [Steroidobacteraceae bacterium]|nr:hypothetical protein [Steroidobacteraceae bacterium]
MTQVPTNVAEQLPPPGVAVLVHPTNIAENWAALEGLFHSLSPWTQLLPADELRAPLTNGTLRLFAVRDLLGNIFVAMAALFTGTTQTCATWLLVGPEAPESIASALVDEVEVFARQQGCCALSINIFPAMVGRIPGQVTALVIERDLRQRRERMN